MKNKFSFAAAYFRSLSYGKKLTVLSTLVLVISLPTLLFVLTQQENIKSNADTTTIIEAESGVVTGNAVVKSSEMASGGKYILLNATSSTQPPTPTTYKAPTPYPTCTPRPACLSAVPRCLVAEPAGGWCPITSSPTKQHYTTVVPRPTSTPFPENGYRNGHGNGSQNSNGQGYQH